MKTLDNILHNFKTELSEFLRQEVKRAKEEAKPKKWPQKGDVYWNYDVKGMKKISFENKYNDHYYFDTGQAFRTYEEVIYYHRHMELQKELRDFADFEPDWSDASQSKFFLHYSHREKKWGMGCCFCTQEHTIFFRTDCREEIQEKFDLDYYFPKPSPEILEKIRGE